MASRYRLTGRLEAGELAELYEAQRDGREKVVVKLFHPKTSDQRYARSVADTTNRLAGLREQTVARILDVGMVRGRLAIIREHVDGHTLGQALQRLMTREVLIPPPLALYAIIQLLETVQQAHDAGAVHGAITPGNVLLGKDGRTVLADFGALAALQAVPELKVFTAKGRGAYRALEVSQGEAPSPLSDVYSLGAIAYELLTLREAVRSSKTVSTRHEALPPPSRLDRRLNARLDPIIMRAIETTPGRRFKSCAEFATALRNFLSASGGMPGRADLARLVSELFPNEVQIQVSPQVPFSEPFSIDEVTGVDLIATPGERSEVLTMRPSFSGGAIPAVLDEGMSGAETIEALPAFRPYQGEYDAPGARGARPAEEPNFDDGTAPGAGVGGEQDWVAPPGAAPVKKKPLGATPVQASAVSPGLKGRFRVMEDFSAPSATSTAIEEPPAEARAASLKSSRERQRGPIERREASPGPEVSQPLSDPGNPFPLVEETGGIKRRMITEERALWAARTRRRRMMAVAIAVAVVGVFCFALVIWRFGLQGTPRGGQEREPGSSGAESQAKTAAPPGPETRAPASRDDEVRPTSASAEERAEADRSPVRIEAEPDAPAFVSPRGTSAYFTVKANVPAYVYIDGKRVKGTTPLTRVKVPAGRRKIVLEAVRTGERRELTLTFKRGKVQSITELGFTHPKR